MKKIIIWLTLAIALIIIGCIIFVGVLAASEWNFKSLSTAEYITQTHEIVEDFKDISVNTNTANIEFLISDSDSTTIKTHEQSKVKYSVYVKNGTLIIEAEDLRKWYDHIGVFFESSKISIYLPDGEYENLSIKTSTGKVEIPENYRFQNIYIEGHTGAVNCNASAQEYIKISLNTGSINIHNVRSRSIELSATTGKIFAQSVQCDRGFNINVTTGRCELKDVTCNVLNTKGDTGDITLTRVIADEKITAERSTGDIKFEACDASEIYIDTDTGDVSGSLLSSKLFIAKTDTGDVNVPNTKDGGICEINTDIGDINITIK